MEFMRCLAANAARTSVVRHFVYLHSCFLLFQFRNCFLWIRMFLFLSQSLSFGKFVKHLNKIMSVAIWSVLGDIKIAISMAMIKAIWMISSIVSGSFLMLFDFFFTVCGVWCVWWCMCWCVCWCVLVWVGVCGGVVVV